MPAKRIARTIVLCLMVLYLLLTLPAIVFSQAWTPPKEEGSMSFTYQTLASHDHLDFTGARVDIGRIRAHTLVMGFEYGLTDRLALDAELAYISSKYTSQLPESPHDDGAYHPTFQDAQLGLRYNVLKNPLVLTPFIGATIPTHDYETRGHSAAGRNFHEFLMGLNVGRQLGPVLPDAYFHVRYSYAVLSHFNGLNLNRSNADWEVGWIATRRCSLRFLGAWQRTQGGLDLPKDLTEENHELHDRVARANYLRLGGGVTFSVSRSLDVHSAYLTTVSGINTHAVGGLAIGISWRFSKGLATARSSVNTSEKKLPTLVPEI